MILQTTPQINIKGIRDGLQMTLGDGSYEEIIAALTQELAQKEAFLQGSRIVLVVGQRPLRADQLNEIQDLLARHRLVLWAVIADKEVTKSAARELSLATRLPGSATDLDGNSRETAVLNPNTPPTKSLPEANTVLFKETIRSGRSIYYEGHVVVIGDVNPGAEIIAAGNVVVWGRLRGLVHAGAMGDQTAVICALELSPTQLRIADQIAISPDDRQRKINPEQASIQNGRITAEPWQTR